MSRTALHCTALCCCGWLNRWCKQTGAEGERIKACKQIAILLLYWMPFEGPGVSAGLLPINSSASQSITQHSML